MGRIGIGGIDTRRLTRAIRQQGAPHVALPMTPTGNFDIEALVPSARGWKGLVGLDLAKDVTCAQSYRWDEMRWAWPEGYARRRPAPACTSSRSTMAPSATSCAAWPRPGAM
jgi:carbamoyl-phosphate synthase small subunit